jgi:hypothetical protein
VAGSTLFVADTNNQRVRTINLADGSVSTLELKGLNPPAPPARRPVFRNAAKETLATATAAPGKDLVLDVTLPIPSGFKLNAGSPMPYVVESSREGLIAYSDAFPATGKRLATPSDHFEVKVPLAGGGPKDGDKTDLTISVLAGICSEGSNLCTLKSFVWTVPVTFRGGAPGKVTVKKGP